MLKIITVGVGIDCSRIIQNCNVKNLRLEVLGKNDTIWYGTAQKILLTYEFVKKCNDDDIIMFVDANDTLLLANEREIITKFLSFDSDLVFSSERVCWPLKSIAEKHPMVRTPYRFLNSGGYIGYAKYIKEWFENNKIHKVKSELDDQLLYQLWYFSDYSAIKLDFECKIFQCMAQAPLYEFKNEKHRLKNALTNTLPCVLHFNGMGKINPPPWIHMVKFLATDKVDLC